MGKNKSMEVTLTTNSTSTKSTRNTTLTTKKTKCTVKSKLSTKESRAALLNGNCAPNKWCTRSKPTGKDVWLQESQNFQSSLLVFTVNVLTNVLVSKRD